MRSVVLTDWRDHQMTEQYLLEAALFREIAETAHTTLELVSKPSTTHLIRIRTIRSDLDRIEAGVVAVLRENGETWENLAVAAGVARQSIYERLNGRSARWVASVRRPAAGNDEALRASLTVAWERVTSDMSTRATALMNLDPADYSNLRALAPQPFFTSSPIDVERRTSPSTTPR